MNYLAKQAARSLSRGAAARPRLPALFEPVTAAAPPPAAAPPDVPRAVEETRTVETPRTLIAERVLRHEVETVRERIERVVPRVERGAAPASGAVVISAAEAAAAPQVVVKRAEPAQTPVEPQTKTTHTTTIDERITRLVERSEPASAPTPITPRVETHTERVIELAPAHPPHPSPPTPISVITRPAERVTPRIVESTPSIRITIGRVDVRAVTEHETPQRPAVPSTAPALSLDDYLKQREGRSR